MQKKQYKTNKEIIEGLLKIRNKRGKQVPFIFNAAQRYYHSKKRRRNLVLKARQKGITKVIDADQLVDCISKSTNAVVISHEREATKRLFSAVKYYVDNLEIKPELSIDSKQAMNFPKRGSSYFIGTAGQKAFGRGDTVDRAHLSEAAFYEDLESILSGISEAAEYGQIDIETTPRGRDYFYDIWQLAKIGKSAYIPIFIPWFIDDEYSVDSMTTKEILGLSDSIQEMFLIPEREFEYTIEERRLIESVKQEYAIYLTCGQIKWRRYKIWDKGDLFFQEYPEDDVSCFLQSGRTVFSKITTDITKRIPLDDISTWKATEEEKKLLKNRRLYGGVDGAEGTPTGDAHSFSVIDSPSYRPTANVIYEYTSNEPIDVFWGKVVKITREYHIQLGIEKNGVGVAHVKAARDLQIPFEEYITSSVNRPLMISELEEAYRKEQLIESYPEAEDEARNMIYNKAGRAEHQSGKHDDRVFARAIAWQIRKKPVPRVTIL